jgi:hypothetical protein
MKDDATLLASLEPFAILKVLLYWKLLLTSDSVGRGSSATIESTSIVLPSLCSSLFCELDFNAYLKKGLFFVKLERQHH